MTISIIERLTKSDSPLVNTVFEFGLTGTLAASVMRIALACWRQTGLIDAIGVTIISLVLWCATLGLYRLWKR